MPLFILYPKESVVSLSGLNRNLRQISKSVRAAIHLEGKHNPPVM